ncbi:class I SAM-dependent methyltransferase [Natrinema altunense]|uniref:Ubiquinone/menaquinone biosynthesis methyltransferase UbiE n=1 Tax=Natrinema altunense (strain JCM 12890 / CGMCC 1.3731 / AJ2) TaxID=1227494 RepID=L9ZHK5_NATA2|nr:class I SAM-dependent methyltransferase [Natrinema altunense]ELY84643.1 ubiquinone/menaquinone biosynthesis methyltransferase UbiE [Natrinema altunense JCM 12890]
MDEVSRTLEEYESDADAYVRKYCAESVAAQYGEPFFDALAGDRLLDVGCGPGSDLSTFESAGYDTVGLDLTSAFLQAACEREPTASLVRGDMRDLPFDDAAFDGLWSSASFLHVPRSDAIATLREFRRVLRPDGIAFLLIKRAPTTAGESRDRHFEYYRADAIRSIVEDVRFEPLLVETEENWVSVLAGAESGEAADGSRSGDGSER